MKNHISRNHMKVPNLNVLNNVNKIKCISNIIVIKYVHNMKNVQNSNNLKYNLDNITNIKLMEHKNVLLVAQKDSI